MSKINKSVLKEVKDFIESKNVCVMATCSKKRPRASTVNYVAKDFTLYVVTSSKSTKVKNIRENPNVGIAIDDQGKSRVCLQAYGTAKILEGREAESAREFYCSKRDISHHKPELVDTILKVELNEITFTDYTNIKEGMKVYKFKILNR